MNADEAISALNDLAVKAEALIVSGKVSPEDELQFKFMFMQMNSFIDLAASFMTIKESMNKFMDSRSGDTKLGNIKYNKYIDNALSVTDNIGIGVVLMNKSVSDYFEKVKFDDELMKEFYEAFHDGVINNSGFEFLVANIKKDLNIK